ncbi:hypothetical protein SAMN05444363_2153 [Flavobacterium terrae]|uniref:Uncharacterized protein n=1 Tax=Flavobacterium terrae TaxID=415425 RepID=A0A1M6F638_9FLAO|nr:hypothetical protein SAMN05444363_2153 [Flavobacterium terrae]
MHLTDYQYLKKNNTIFNKKKIFHSKFANHAKNG